nr:hypothetical protein [Saccharopolyspora pogona]
MRSRFEQAAASGQQAGVVHQYVDAAEMADHPVDDGPDRFGVAHVAHPRIGPGGLVGDVEFGDLRAFVGEAVGDGTAETTGGAGDDGDAAGQTL